MTDYGTLLRDHVTLRCCCIDRIFLQAYAATKATGNAGKCTPLLVGAV